VHTTTILILYFVTVLENNKVIFTGIIMIRASKLQYLSCPSGHYFLSCRIGIHINLYEKVMSTALMYRKKNRHHYEIPEVYDIYIYIYTYEIYTVELGYNVIKGSEYFMS
jgi:hypothetical protein